MIQASRVLTSSLHRHGKHKRENQERYEVNRKTSSYCSQSCEAALLHRDGPRKAYYKDELEMRCFEEDQQMDGSHTYWKGSALSDAS